MREQFFDLNRILRLSLELAHAVKPNSAIEQGAAEQQLIDALNPTPVVFPGDGEAVAEREQWRIGNQGCRSDSLGWLQVLSRSGLPVRERNALWSIAVGLSDLRGGHSSGLSLLAAGNRELRAELPADNLDTGVTIPLLRVGDTGGRLIGPDWRTLILHADGSQPASENHDSCVLGTYRTRDGQLVPVHRDDCVPSDAGVPTVCSVANPPPSIQEGELDDFLGWTEQRFREDGLIRESETIHWVGPGRVCSHCFCSIVRPTGRSLPPEWAETRAGYRSANEILAFVRPRCGRPLTAPERAEMNRIGVAAGGLIRLLGVLPLPQGAVPYGALGVPAVIGPEGVTLTPDEGSVWESRCRAARHDAACRLESLGREFLVSSLPPFDLTPTIPAELRAIPDGIPEHLAEAYRALVEAVSAASEMYYEAPQPTFGYEESLDLLAGRRKSLSDQDDYLDPLVAGALKVFRSASCARGAYTAVEAILVTHAVAGGCAFKAAFAAIRGVTEVAGSVLGVPGSETMAAEPTYQPSINLYQAAVTLARCSPFQPATLLAPAREQLLRASEAARREQEHLETIREMKPICTRGDKRATVEGRMREILNDTDLSLKWSAKTWSERLGCGPTTVKQTRTWADIRKQRAAGKPPAVDRHWKQRHE